jgi:hypothetical protein
MTCGASRRGAMGDELQPPSEPRTELATDDELPVVARLIVEIRSDGTRTVARGALEDAITGQKVGVTAHGSTPIALASALARTMLSVPALAKNRLWAAFETRLLGRRRDPDR